MLTTRKDRPSDIGVMVSRTVLSVVRILIASYFLAAATGLIFEPASRTFLDAVLPQSQAQLVTTTYLFITSFAIMVGVLVRPAALLLSVYIFWSGFLHYDLAQPAALAAFWRDMALLGAVLMIAVTEQGAGTQVRVWRRSVAPRRVSGASEKRKPRPAEPRAEQPQQQAAENSSARLTGFAHESGEIDIYEFHTRQDDDAAEIVNIFAELWDEAPEKPATA